MNRVARLIVLFKNIQLKRTLYITFVPPLLTPPENNKNSNRYRRLYSFAYLKAESRIKDWPPGVVIKGYYYYCVRVSNVKWPGIATRSDLVIINRNIRTRPPKCCSSFMDSRLEWDATITQSSWRLGTLET